MQALIFRDQKGDVLEKMPLREKDRKLHRRQRRRGKLKALKEKLNETKDVEKRRMLEEKIRRLQPWGELKGAPE